MSFERRYSPIKHQHVAADITDLGTFIDASYLRLDGTNDNNVWARLADNETITGEWTFADSILSTKSGVRNLAGLQIAASQAGIYLDATGATTDERKWGIDALSSSGQGYFRLSTATDANGFGESVLEVQRTGTAPATWTFNGATFLFNPGNVFVGNLYVDNNNYVYADDSAGVARSMLGVDSGNTAYVANNNFPTIVRGSTIDVDGPLTANSYDGISAANLVDKTATEAISGSWTFSNTVFFTNASGPRLNNNTALRSINNAGSVNVSLAYLSTSDIAIFGDASYATEIRGTSVTIPTTMFPTRINGNVDFGGFPDFEQGLATASVRTRNGQELILNAGESHSYATGQTAEYVYVNAESGLQINSSPDNWTTGWAGRNTATINDSSGNSSLPGDLSVTGALTANTFGGISSANLLDKSASETISGAYVFTANPRITSTAPILLFDENDVSVDSGHWGVVASGAQFTLRTYNDGFSASDIFMRVARSGNAATAIDFEAPVYIRDAMNVDTATNSLPLRISRLGASNEALAIGVDDNSVRFNYTQDETDTTAHSYIFDTTTSATGAHYMEFRGNGTAYHRFYNQGAGYYLLEGGNFRLYDSTNTRGVQMSSDSNSFDIQTLGTGIVTVNLGIGANQVDLTGGTDLRIRDAGFLRIYDSTDADYVQFQHDGTDLNVTEVGTTDMNLNGFVAVNVQNSLTCESLTVDGGSVTMRNALGGEILNIRDTAGAGSLANPYFAFRDSANTRLGYVGFGSIGNNDLYIVPDSGLTRVSSTLIPNADSSYECGNSSTAWLRVYSDNYEFGNNTDTTLTRLAAGKLGVEGKAVIKHTGSYTSGEVTVSTSAPSGGSNGDIWLQY